MLILGCAEPSVTGQPMLAIAGGITLVLRGDDQFALRFNRSRHPWPE
jgi:hypothetical protein